MKTNQHWIGVALLFLVAASSLGGTAEHVGRTVVTMKASNARALLDDAAWRLTGERRSGSARDVRRFMDARRERLTAVLPAFDRPHDSGSPHVLAGEGDDFDLELWGKGFLVGLLTQILPFLNDVETWEGAKANMTRCIVAPVKDMGAALREAFDAVRGIDFPSLDDLKQLGEDFRESFDDLRKGVTEFDIPSLVKTASDIFTGNKGIKNFIDTFEEAVKIMVRPLIALALELHQCGYSAYALAILLVIILMANPIGWLILALKVILAIAVVVDIVAQVRKAIDAFKRSDWFVFGVALGIILGDLFDLIAVAKSDLFRKKDQVNKYEYRTEKGKLVTELEDPPAELAGNAKQYGKTVKRSYTADVVKVYDGDTITVRRNGVDQKIRFAGIDAPEMSQPGGPEAQKTLQDLIDANGGKVKVMSYGTDLYGRETADIFAGKTWAQSELLSKGRAWHYRAYDSRKHLDDLLRTAQQSKTGLWANANNVAPWDYRKGRNIKATIPTSPEDMSKIFPSWVAELLSLKKMFRSLVPSITEIIDWAKDVLTAAPIDTEDVFIPTQDPCGLEASCPKFIPLGSDQKLSTGYAPQNGTKTYKFTRGAGKSFKVDIRTSFGTVQAVLTDGEKAWTLESSGETDLRFVPVPDYVLPIEGESTSTARRMGSTSGTASTTTGRDIVIVTPEKETEYTVEITALQASAFDVITTEPSEEDYTRAEAGQVTDGAGASEKSSGMSAGAGAGIAIGAIAAAAALAVAVMVILKRRASASPTGNSEHELRATSQRV